MSEGPGAVESRIAQLFAATSVAELAETATREQRLSATRAGHCLIRRMKEADERASRLVGEARREAEAAVGPMPSPKTTAAPKTFRAAYTRYDPAFKATEASGRAMKLHTFNDRFGSWVRSTSGGSGHERTSTEAAAVRPEGRAHGLPSRAPWRPSPARPCAAAHRNVGRLVDQTGHLSPPWTASWPMLRMRLAGNRDQDCQTMGSSTHCRLDLAASSSCDVA